MEVVVEVVVEVEVEVVVVVVVVVVVGGGEGGDKKHNFKVKTVRLGLKSRNNQLEGSVQQTLSINIKIILLLTLF